MALMNIQTVDFTQGNQVYAPSWEELKGIEAVHKKKTSEALEWFDRAILSDPSRGPRIFDMCCQLGFGMKIRYLTLSHAAHHHDHQRYVDEIKRIMERHPEGSYPDLIERAEAIRWQNYSRSEQPMVLKAPEDQGTRLKGTTKSKSEVPDLWKDKQQ